MGTMLGDALPEMDAGCWFCFEMWGQVSGTGCVALFVFKMSRLSFGEEDRRLNRGGGGEPSFQLNQLKVVGTSVNCEH